MFDSEELQAKFRLTISISSYFFLIYFIKIVLILNVYIIEFKK